MGALSDEVGILLMKAVMLEAHMAAMQAAMDSRGRGTASATVNAAVEAAFTFAVHNNLIVVNDPEDWPIFLESVPK